MQVSRVPEYVNIAILLKELEESELTRLLRAFEDNLKKLNKLESENLTLQYEIQRELERRQNEFITKTQNSPT